MKSWNNRIVVLTLCVIIRNAHMQTTSSISGTLHKGQGIIGIKMKSFSNVGLKMCAKICYRATSCGAFSYHKKSLTCQMYSGNSTSLTPDPDYVSGNLSEWDGFDSMCSRFPCPEKYQTCYEGKNKRFCMNDMCRTFPTVTSKFLYLDTFGKTRHIEDVLELKCKDSFILRGNAKIVCQPNEEFTQPDNSTKCYRTINDYVLAARFTPGIGTSVYQTWMSNMNSDNDVLIQDECFSIGTNGQCKKHYLSGLVGEWTTLEIYEVRLALYKAGTEVAYISFTGDSVSKNSWFNPSKIISSSWSDVKVGMTTNVFSIYGLDNPAIRRFYISYYLGVCTADDGWFCVVEAFGFCPYDKQGGYPYFMYSKRTTKALLYKDFLKADVMAILVKIKNFP